MQTKKYTKRKKTVTGNLKMQQEIKAKSKLFPVKVRKLGQQPKLNRKLIVKPTARSSSVGKTHLLPTSFQIIYIYNLPRTGKAGGKIAYRNYFPVKTSQKMIFDKYFLTRLKGRHFLPETI